ncbi:hypothetical protein [Parasitella parasitica]|uniref:Uncharacterized protein n=1 Tax=Parasitella parasitica TaxID=35722 RepID=A0A0B7NS33_9FUNG|nr:hypothetical protein [Parasitella parasitica]
MEFPAILTANCGVSKTVADLLRPCMQNSVGPQRFQNILRKIHTLRHDRLKLQYLISAYSKEHGIAAQLNISIQPNIQPFSSFDDQNPYAGYVPTGTYFRTLYTANIQKLQPKMDKHKMLLDGKRELEDVWRGESTSAASKFERQVNENEYGAMSQYIMGRRIDLLLKGHLSDDKDKQQIIEMAAMEIKSTGVCLETEVIQLNKNVRVNKSILGCLRSHCGEYADDSLFTIGMDVIGLSGYHYVIKQFEDVVVATKAHDENMFLPAGIDEIMDFMNSNTLDQLLNYMDEITSLYQKVKLSSKRFKRQRTSSRTSNSVAPRVSPPPSNHEFPGATFFTPKRPTNKKSQE